MTRPPRVVVQSNKGPTDKADKKINKLPKKQVEIESNGETSTLEDQILAETILAEKKESIKPASEIEPQETVQPIRPISEDGHTLYWNEWRVQLDSKRDDEFFYCVCPRCHPSKPAGAEPTLLANTKTGSFFCHICGLHGDAKFEPKAYRANRINFKRPYWANLSHNDLKRWMQLKFPENIEIPDIEVKQDITFFKTPLGVEQRNAFLFPCRIEKEGEIQTFIVLPFVNENKFEEPVGMPGSPVLPWGMDELDLAEKNEIVFVNHPLDRIALMMSGISNVVCLNPNSNPLAPNGGDWSSLAVFEKQLFEVRRFVMAMPYDEQGIKQSNELARRLGRDRSFLVRWQHIPKLTGELPHSRDALIEQGPEKLQEMITNAPSFPIAGIKELFDVNDKIENIYEFGYQPGASLGWVSAEEYISLQTGEFTLVIGIPGHGKSTIVDNICNQMAKIHGKICAVYSPQSKPVERHFARFMEKYVEKSIVQGRYIKMDEETKDKAKSWVNKHIKIILDEEDSKSESGIDYIISKARSLVLRHGISILAIDSWLDINHVRPNHLTDVEYTQEQINKLIRFCQMYGIHLIISHHPNKLSPGSDGKYPIVTPYMLQGGGVWRNAPDNILSVYRNVGQQDEDIVDGYVQKIRNEENGKIGMFSLRYKAEGGNYVDDINQDRRRQAIKNGGEMKTSELIKSEAENQISKRGNSKGVMMKTEGFIGNSKKPIGSGPFTGRHEPTEDPFENE